MGSASINRTYQDFELASDKLAFICDSIREYKGNSYYKYAVTANSYFCGNNEYIMGLKPLRVQLASGDIEVKQTKIPSNIFKRLVLQLCSYQLSNGVEVNKIPLDDILGNKASKKLLLGAVNAMVQGVGYAYINNNNLQRIYKATEMFTLDDEWSGLPQVAVNFWEIETHSGTQAYAQVFEVDGITTIKITNGGYEIKEDKQSYVSKIIKKPTGEQIIENENPQSLPIVKLFVNESGESELTYNIKSKIDNLDEIVSRNASFVNKTAMIFWLINSTGIGDPKQIGNMVEELEKLGIAVNEDDGLSASPQVLDPQVNGRLQTKQNLEDDIYKDFMSLNTESLTKGNLTATAINTSAAMLKIKGSELYYYISEFLINALKFVGMEVDSIYMKEDTLSNDLEFTQMVYTARADLPHRKVLQLLPFIESDEVDSILADFDAENMSDTTSLEELQAKIDAMEKEDEAPEQEPQA